MTDSIKLSMLINADESRSIQAQSNDTPIYESTMDHHMTDNSEEPPHKKVRGRKKILQGPPYICDYPNCHKEFQRSEHLSRHQLNHNPKKIYECTEPGCTKTFVRHDLLIRHLKRHVNKLAKKGVIQDKTGEKQKLKLKDKLELERQTSDDGYEDHVNTPFVLESTEKALGPVNNGAVNNGAVNSGAVNQPLTQPNGQVNMNVSHHGFPPSPGAYTRQQQNASKPFTSVTQILQQHSQSPVVNPGMSEDLNREFAAPNLLSWLFNVNSNVPSSTVSQPDDFLTGLNEFQMNNGGQSFFIPDGLEQVSPSSSSTIGVYQTSERQPTPGGSISETSPQIQQQRRQPSVSINGEIANKQGQINIGSSPVDTAAAQARYDAGKHYDAANPDNESLYRLSEAKLNEFVQLIPEVKGHPDFTKSKLEKSLKMYWKFFHPRFPMLHRPSFNSLETPPLLLLSMIVLGVKLSQCVDDITCPAAEKFQRPKSLADKIALPLRWLLFASPQFQPPATLWIIQSLLMLEFYEENCTTRQLHERAHLHHGTTIQLLRRSPTLGGSPHKLNSGSDDAGNWFKWIEIESMKRATFMCFYMDAIDAISFGHQMLIYAHQIQMTMPVEDDVWESNLRNFRSSIKKCKRPKPFLIVLKNILNGLPTRTNSFGKKVLLAGLSAIMFQIQQRDMQLMFGLDKFGMTGTVSNWRELLAAAFSIWRNDVGGSCCSSRTAIDNMSSMNNSLQFSTSDTRCKCITYHMAHVYMSISHYDLFIVAGAPWRMNVKPSSPLEREQTEKRVSEWASTRHSEVCIVQCYLLLFETFLSPQDSSYEYQYDYLPDQDLFFRSYVIGLCTMVVWCYVHGRYGKDAFAKTAMTYRNREYEEDGYRYLKRMRNEFTRRSGGIMLHTWFSNCSGAEFYGNLGKWVDVLEDIPDKQNMVGLLELVGNKMVNADYTVVKEIGKLLLFCRDRCRGSNETILRDMYGQ